MIFFNAEFQTDTKTEVTAIREEVGVAKIELQLQRNKEEETERQSAGM